MSDTPYGLGGFQTVPASDSPSSPEPLPPADPQGPIPDSPTGQDPPSSRFRCTKPLPPKSSRMLRNRTLTSDART